MSEVQVHTRREAIGRLMAGGLGLSVLGLSGCARQEDARTSTASGPWVPQRPITVVIGYDPGGGTDTMARATMPGIGEALGTKQIRYLNKPGNVAAVATDYVWNQPSDGHSWLFASNYNKFLRAAGYHETIPYSDWQFFRLNRTTQAFSVRPDSPLETFEDFLDAASASEEAVSVSNAGTGDVWHIGSAIVEQAAGVKFNHVAFDGGAPGVLAGMSGEVDVVGSGLHEQIEYLRSGDLRNLGVFTPDPIEVEGLDPLSPITDALPEAEAWAPYGGGTTFALKRDTDPDALKSTEKAVVDSFGNDEMRKIMNQQFLTPALRTGGEADKEAAYEESVTAWIMKDLGLAEKDPGDLNIPQPEEFDQFWPPEGYESVLGAGQLEDSF